MESLNERKKINSDTQDEIGLDSLRVIFLDVDGVLACSRSILCDYDDKDPTLLFDIKGKMFPLERSRLENLSLLIAKTGAKVVLTTTWRLKSEMREFLMTAFQEYGIASEVIGNTPQRSEGRGFEILEWLEEHKSCSAFVVIDDEHEESISLALGRGHLVKTFLNRTHSSEEGLTIERTSLAIKMLI